MNDLFGCSFCCSALFDCLLFYLSTFPKKNYKRNVFVSHFKVKKYTFSRSSNKCDLFICVFMANERAIKHTIKQPTEKNAQKRKKRSRKQTSTIEITPSKLKKVNIIQILWDIYIKQTYSILCTHKGHAFHAHTESSVTTRKKKETILATHICGDGGARDCIVYEYTPTQWPCQSC